MVTLTYNLSIWEANTGGSRVQRLPQPDNEPWPSLDDPVSKQKETCVGGGCFRYLKLGNFSFLLELVVMLCVFVY